MQLHFLRERQEALKGQGSPLTTFLDLLISLLFLTNWIINAITAFIEHGNTIEASDATLFFGHHVGSQVTSTLVIFLAILIIRVQGRVCGITGWEPITSVPAWILGAHCIIVLAAILTLQGGQLAVILPFNMSFWFFILTDLRRKQNKQERARAQEALQTKSQPQAQTQQSQVQQCEVCHEESKYDLCLECYKRHRGERHRVNAQMLRAKKAGVPATLTLAQWLETLENFHYRCAYCHGPYECLEHYIPIVEGGGTTFDNCLPACISCNSSKGDKHPEK